MDDKEFMASVISEMNDKELEAFCDALAYSLGSGSKTEEEHNDEQ